MANNRICLACGKAYEYCGSCPSSLNLPVWKNIFDTENCKTVFETVSDYAQNAITKESAKNKLSKCNTSISFKEQIQNYVDEILRDDVRVATDNVIKQEKTINRKKTISKSDD